LSRLVEIVKARINQGKLFKTDTDNLMLNRPSIPSYHQNGVPAGDFQTPTSSGDGQASEPKPTLAPFLPNYSGDGHGKPASWSGDGRSTVQSEPMPVWSGGGRHDVLNPMMPTWGASNGGYSRPAVSYNAMTSLNSPAASLAASQMSVDAIVKNVSVPLSDELYMNVNVPAQEKRADTRTKSQKSSGTWKLIALVVVFMVWVSTASTLLFLYMDRYLFP